MMMPETTVAPTTIQQGADALARICADTRAETATRKAAKPLELIKAKARAAGPVRGFGRALMDGAANGFALIAEIKKASPSGGLIRPDFDPAAIARAYKAAGATCLSVLTDAPHFQGSPEHLRLARAAADLPILRKDFILEPWQVYESRAMGADCILLILAALTDDEAHELERIADAIGLDVLVEVHEPAELERALGMQTRLIGVNNRNLKTLKTDINTSLELSALLPPDRFLVGESGLRTHADLLRLAAAGVRSFLVGESLLRHDDIEAATRTLLFG
jgi:indole-3-glycerol phosphate synthase